MKKPHYTIDWKKVKIGTPLLIINEETQKQEVQYFVEHKKDVVNVVRVAKDLDDIKTHSILTQEQILTCELTNIYDLNNYSREIGDFDYKLRINDIDWRIVPQGVPLIILKDGYEYLHYFYDVENYTPYLSLYKAIKENEDFNAKNDFSKTTFRFLYPEQAELYKYKEKKIDWSKVPTDTPVITKGLFSFDSRNMFYKFENDDIYVYNNGKNSYTASDYPYDHSICSSNNVRLARLEDEEKYEVNDPLP